MGFASAHSFYMLFHRLFHHRSVESETRSVKKLYNFFSPLSYILTHKQRSGKTSRKFMEKYYVNKKFSLEKYECKFELHSHTESINSNNVILVFCLAIARTLHSGFYFLSLAIFLHSFSLYSIVDFYFRDFFLFFQTVGFRIEK
jgi:hypothetical protein